MNLRDLMPDVHEYPNPTATPLRAGVRYEYISSTHLDGWINYVRPVAAYVSTRYADDGHEGNARRVAAWTDSPPAHCKLSAFEDDMFILARGETPGDWWLFEYDCDVSDCALGRFEFGGDEHELLEAFETYTQRQTTPIDVKKMTGWVGW